MNSIACVLCHYSALISYNKIEFLTYNSFKKGPMQMELNE